VLLSSPAKEGAAMRNVSTVTTAVNALRIYVTLAAAMLATCIVVLAATVEPAQAAFPGRNGKIVFINIPAQNVWQMNRDGSAPVPLTSPDNPFEHDPAWSADGSSIAFARAVRHPSGGWAVRTFGRWTRTARTKFS
jgi:hypothetical protein